MENFVLDENTHMNKKKIFIPTIGTLGDVIPFWILAKELKKRGHTVWLGVHKTFQNQIEADGIDTIEIGGDVNIAIPATPEGVEHQRNPSVSKIDLVKRVYLPLLEEWFDAILFGSKDADLIILTFPTLLPGISCMEKYPNMKAVAIYTFPNSSTAEFSPPYLGGKSESRFNWINSLKWKMFLYSVSRVFNDKINQLRANINLPPIGIKNIIQSVLKKPMLTATLYSKYLLSRPADWPENIFMVGAILQDDQNEFQPTDDLQQFLDKWKNEKIIYIGLGSMMSTMFSPDERLQFLTTIQTTIENTNYKAILSLVGFQNIDENKLLNHENIFYLKHAIPHTWLFTKISAAVHHGGSGTTHTSLRFGLPTLTLPVAFDQPFTADRVFIHKLGPRPIPIRQMNVKNLTEAIQDLMNNYTMYRINAQKIGQLIKDEDALGQCVQIVEKELKS